MEKTMVDHMEERAQPRPPLSNPDLDGLMDIELQDILKEAHDAGFGVSEVTDALTRAIARIRSEHEPAGDNVDNPN
jgi:hypothetical protein